MSVPSYVTIKCPAVITQRVTVIKAIRQLTGLGLKEAKDLQDEAHTVHEQATMPGISDALFEESCRILRNEGVEVNGSVYIILQDLRNLGAQALSQGEDELANEILQLVLAEKLRRNINFGNQ